MNVFRVPTWIAIVLALTIFPFSGLKGEEGYLLGLAASAFNLTALWMGIKMFANPQTLAIQPKQQMILIGLMCFVKMPVFIGAGFLSYKIGSPAPPYYIAGVALVYSVMIWWACKAR